MAQADLCSYCDKIPFSEFAAGTRDDRRRVDKSDNTYCLGAASRILQSDCPFCLLACEATLLYRNLNSSRLPLSPGRDVEVVWAPRTVTRTRGGFVITGQEDVWLAFGSDSCSSASGASPPHSYLLPKLPVELDVSRVAGWIDHCTSHHICVLFPHTMMFGEAFPGLRFLRFIDTIRGCIVQKTEPVQYAVLSYVWGSYPTFRLTKANLDKLMVPGALLEFPRRLPRTLQDAILLAKRLNIRFLWVDALCLLQNSSDDLEKGVNVMDQIYERAWISIVAANGHDSNAGLPGVQPGERAGRVLVKQVKQGVSMGVYVGTELQLQRSVYETRAWTFQEHVLSRRILYFFPDSVVFRCRESEFLEVCADDPTLGRQEASLTSMLADAIITTDGPAHQYEVFLLYYTRRALTNDADALRAMAGILRRLSHKLRCRMLQGLPTSQFDRYVLLRGPAAGRRRGFPSYSWAGWRDSLGFLRIGTIDTRGWLRDQTWIVWYKGSPAGVVSPVWDPAENLEFVPFRGLRTSRTMPTLDLGPGPVDTTETSQAGAEPPRLYPYHLLQFWTIVIYVKLQNIDVFWPRGDLIGTDGRRCGRLGLDGFHETTFFESERPFEVILLSESQGDEDEVHWTVRPREWKAYHVMVIEWHGGVAERRGLGTVLKSAVHRSFSPGPVWKEVIMG
ncbi:heterokaryon incompatibility protein-domain-containing protein [Chaetomium strumarium]|uniref:Heterokaryon incompatibility protein-domain-containing protein n=1 Tax=Chaetomium strumarium TaxID=1170767 RepID=A0AAJ0GU53_9PEZI|nr:heterokaryon incompatibility protein-domain-containing protein [Chaetomium strumarium]